MNAPKKSRIALAIDLMILGIGVYVLTLGLAGVQPAIAQESFEAQDLPSLSEVVPQATWTQPQRFSNYRNALRWAGGIVQASVLLLVLVHLAAYGYHSVRPAGRAVKRYSWVEVLLHDILALSFVGAWATATYLILAKHVLGYGERELAVPFGGFASTAHLVSGLVFLAAAVVLFLLWRPAMRFAPYDREWLRRLGGYFSREHPVLPAGKFNAGQKIWFRVSMLLGLVVSLSGALFYYPALLGVGGSILVYVLHTVTAVALSAMVIAHIYVAVVAHPHAARAMLTGEVDEASAREDHPLEPIGGIREA